MERMPAIYIITNRRNGTLYTGVTSNLRQRIRQHRNHLCDGFSKKYNLTILVHYELLEDMYTAISREKQIKAGSRKRKIELIELHNPYWNDLYLEIVQDTGSPR